MKHAHSTLELSEAFVVVGLSPLAFVPNVIAPVALAGINMAIVLNKGVRV